MVQFSVDLVYPASVFGSENYSCEPPLGLIALYSTLPENWRKQTRILDGTVTRQSEIANAIRARSANIVAFSCTTFNYLSALELAKIAKNNNSLVVMGGIHITNLRDVILNKMLKKERPIDFLVTGFGEMGFKSLLHALEAEASLKNIPNLCYIDNDKIVTNPIISNQSGIDPLTKPLDFSQIDLSIYSERFQRYGNLSSVKTIGTIFTQRGCPKMGKNKCIFCSIEQSYCYRSTELIREDVFRLISKHNTDHIRISDANFTSNIRHMSNVAYALERASFKTNNNPSFYCFARADDINESSIEILKRINVTSVFIGYESGSNKILDIMGKRTTKDINLKATKLLKQNGIEVICAGIVLGAECETEKTLQETLHFVHQLKAIENTRSLVATPLMPLPGSKSFNRLLKVLAKVAPKKYNEIKNTDLFNIETLIELWNKYFCKVPLFRLYQICEEIGDKFQLKIKFLKNSEE